MSTASIHATSPAIGKAHPPRDPRTFWRVSLAVLAPIPAVALAVSDLVSPDRENASDKESFTAIAAHTGAAAADMWFSGVFALGLFPAVVAVLWACRRHAPRLTAVVGAITLLGVAGGLTVPTYTFNDYVAVKKGLDPATVLALNKDLQNQPRVIVTTVLFLLGMVLVGRILLGVLLWRSGIAPRWMAVALIIAGPLDVFGPSGLLIRNGTAGLAWLLTAVGFAAASRALLRMRNDDFDLPPVCSTADPARDQLGVGDHS